MPRFCSAYIEHAPRISAQLEEATMLLSKIKAFIQGQPCDRYARLAANVGPKAGDPVGFHRLKIEDAKLERHIAAREPGPVVLSSERAKRRRAEFARVVGVE